MLLRKKKKIYIKVSAPTIGSCETDSNSENVDACEKKQGGKVYLYQSLCS